MKTIKLVWLFIATVFLTACDMATDIDASATLVITNASVWTGNADAPWAEAVAVTGDRITAVGSAEEIAAYIGPDTQIVNVPGSMLVPGFIDTHVHFLDGGTVLSSVQLRDASTPEEFRRRIGEFAADLEPGEWILGGTWDHQLWGGELPRRDWIDDITPSNPVWIQRLDGHMALANSLALAAGGVDADTADIEGGVIVRYEDGRPTGLLKDNAMAPVAAAIPPPSETVLDGRIRAAMDHVLSNGITTVHDVANLVDWTNFEIYQRLHSRGELRTRIYSIVPLQTWERLRQDVEIYGTGDVWLRIGGLKGMMDGALGSHTAAFLEPFTDAPDDSGFLIIDLDDMRDWVMGADAAGLHVNVHAIGDKAIRDLLDIYHDVAEQNGPRDRRFRIEHAQHPHPDDIERFAVQDVIASMQPYHAIDDGRWAESVIGPERIKTTYAFRSLIDAGVHVAFGSDWTVAPATPLEGIYAAVTRRTIDGANPDGWVPEQRITVEEALRAYTYEGAYASFEEDLKGTIKPGLLADFVLLDRDITAIDPVTIADTEVLMTIVGGNIAYERNVQTMNLTELTEFATRYAAAWSSQNPAALAAFYAADGSLTVNDGVPAAGRAAVEQKARGFMTAFPDMVVELVEVRLEGSTAEFHWRWTGTNTGPDGTGNAVDLVGYEAWTINADGLIEQSIGHYDDEDYRRQISARL